MISSKTSKMLRGIAILIVIASHYAGWMYEEPIHQKAHDLISVIGPFGVDIFLLLSGYGLVKSSERSRRTKHNNSGINTSFVIKRVFGAYIPCVLCMTLINLYDGTWKSASAEGVLKDKIIDVLTAHGFWYMNVLFVMYVAFMLIYRLGGGLRVILITAAVIGQTYYLYSKGYADFWEVSNMSFLIGIYAAEAESKWPNITGRVIYKLIIGLIGLIGAVYTYGGLKMAGGRGVSGAFSWDMAFGIFYTLIILCIALMIPTWKGLVLTTLGECSLFIYMLHTTMFWALVYRFEEKGYAVAASISGFITLAFGVLLGVLYNSLTGMITRRLK